MRLIRRNTLESQNSVLLIKELARPCGLQHQVLGARWFTGQPQS